MSIEHHLKGFFGIVLTAISWSLNNIDLRFYDAVMFEPFLHIAQTMAAIAGGVLGCMAIVERGYKLYIWLKS